eukprot:SAG11_NODE_3281_length_2553_cov_4.911573_2_plen_196_part_00
MVEHTGAEYASWYKARLSHRHLEIKPSDYPFCPDFALLYYKLTGVKISGYIQDLLEDPNANGSRHRRNRHNDTHKSQKRKCVAKAKANRLITSNKYFVDTRSKLLYRASEIGEDILCIPNTSQPNRNRPNFREILMKEVHDNPLSIHLGQDRTVAELQRRVYWPSIRLDVNAWMHACVPCQRNKIDRRKPQGLLR